MRSTSWTWLNRDSTSDYDTYKRYVDLSAEMGWEYLLLDDGWQPEFGEYYDWFDDLLEYAKTKNVKLLVWVDHNKIKDQDTRRATFEEWADMGIAGVKPDWFNSDSQEYMQLYDGIMEDAATYHLLINLHGCPQTHGERRTYPFMLTREGLLGGETPSRLTAFHNCMLPFTRMAIGPADYTPMFHIYSDVDFSVAQMAAMAVVYESGIQCLADKPVYYLASPAREYFQDIPSGWDESKMLAADPGNLVIMARRSGEEWYIGGMCVEQHNAEIDLSFLGEGDYYAVICKDGADISELVSEKKIVTNRDVLTVPMLENGGFAICIMREDPSPDSLVLDYAELTMELNDSQTITATAYRDGNPVAASVNWSSSDPTVATINNGEIRAVGAGTATITATVDAYGKTLTAKCEVKVTLPAYIPAEGWTVVNQNEYCKVEAENKILITTQVGDFAKNYQEPNNYWLYDAPEGDFTLTIKVSGGLNAHAQKVGVMVFDNWQAIASVTRRYHNSLGKNIFGMFQNLDGVWGENAVADTQKDVPAYLKLERTGNTFKGWYKYEGEEDWTAVGELTNETVGQSADMKIGVFAVNGSTDANIPVTIEDFNCNGEQIAFGAKTVEGVTLNKSALILEQGDNEVLVATVLPENAVDKTVTWSSDNDSIATVDQFGNVVAVGEGTAVITVTTTNGGYTASCVVTVTGSSSSSASVTRYDVTVEETSNGTVKVSNSRPSAGLTVTVTLTPDEGYKADGVTVTDAKGNAVAVTDKGDSKYTFRMPRSNVTVKASFTKDDTPVETGLPFTDVENGVWVHRRCELGRLQGHCQGLQRHRLCSQRHRDPRTAGYHPVPLR
ncbi:glycoside hydrolase family 97 catalytic domain-containing protein [Flavonifractor sp. An91]|uniref:glycoside hydrolase family 97 catalytic domain-containing protein n=1 Tax=Flavonifractor sp. An91 TaxID=1965665 RepID=UPI0031BBB333